MSISDKIWITSKSRVQSENRMNWYANFSHVILSYYSAMMILYSILSISDPSRDKQYVQIVVALGVLLASLISYGFKFELAAKKYRDCYLALDELYNRNLKDERKTEVYAEILRVYPNHRNRDYVAMILEAKRMGKSVRDSDGNDIEISHLALFKYWLESLIYLAGFILLCAFPIWALIEIFWPTKLV